MATTALGMDLGPDGDVVVVRGTLDDDGVMHVELLTHVPDPPVAPAPEVSGRSPAYARRTITWASTIATWTNDREPWELDADAASWSPDDGVTW